MKQLPLFETPPPTHQAYGAPLDERGPRCKICDRLLVWGEGYPWVSVRACSDCVREGKTWVKHVEAGQK